MGTADPYPRHRPISAAEARAADAEAVAAGVPGIVLMEHAGRGLARVAADGRRGRGPVVVLCGPGQNGGDGFACARFLASWGVEVRVLATTAGPGAGDAAVERSLWAREGPVVVLEDAARLGPALDGAAAAVDALFGVGLARPLDARHAAIVERLNAAPVWRLGADVPSGLDADDGVPRDVAVEAHATAAMGAVKRGCARPAAARWCGVLVEVDVGWPASVHRRFLA